MKIAKVFSLAVCVCLCVLLTQVAWAQTGNHISVSLSDMLTHDTTVLVLGYHPNASYGIDGPLVFGPGDTVSEFEAPPLPPTGAFDVRTVSQFAKDSVGAGATINIHRELHVIQTDRWKINFQCDTAAQGGPFKIWWPSGLASKGAGFWGVFDLFGNLLADMTTQTSLTLTADINPQSIYIISGDTLGFLTATSDTLAFSADNKGKVGKAVAAKPYNSDATFSITSPTDTRYRHLHVEFSEGILAFESLNPAPLSYNAPTSDGKTSKFDLLYAPAWPAAGIPASTPLNFTVHGAKGKGIVLKTYWFLIDSGGAKKEKYTKVTGPAPSYSRVWLYMPDWVNVLNELYVQGATGLTANGLTVGVQYQVATIPGRTPKPIIRYVTHKKAGDVLKSLYSKALVHSLGLPASDVCFETYNAKRVTKPQNGYSPAKQENPLFGELLALKFNIAMSQFTNKVDAGFGDLVYQILPGDTSTPAFYNGKTVSQISALGDSAFSCDSSIVYKQPFSLVALHNVVLSINNAFAGKFDTVAFAGKTILKKARTLATVPILVRSGGPLVERFVDNNWVYKPIPETFRLDQNYPNPFNPTTTIQFNLPADGFVTLKVYNILGQEVATLYDHVQMTEGLQHADFNGADVASGVYFYRLVAQTVDENGQLGTTFTQVKKMMLVK